MRNVLIETFCLVQPVCWVVSGVITFTGHEGGEAKIRCPYSMGYENNPKYLCRGDCPVTNKDIVVRIEDDRALALNGRFALSDNREGREFTVTISGLTHQDSGKYWCAISTGSLKMDVYTEVKLVVDAPVIVTHTTPQTEISAIISTQPYLQTPPSAVEGGTRGGTQENGPLNYSPRTVTSTAGAVVTKKFDNLLFITVGLITVLVTGLVLYILYRMRNKLSPGNSNRQTSGTGNSGEDDSAYVVFRDGPAPGPAHKDFDDITLSTQQRDGVYLNLPLYAPQNDCVYENHVPDPL